MIYDVEIGPGTIFLEHVTEQVAAAGYAGTVHSMAEGGRPGLTAGLYLAHSPWFFLLTPGARCLVLEVLISWSLQSVCVLS